MSSLFRAIAIGVVSGLLLGGAACAVLYWTTVSSEVEADEAFPGSDPESQGQLRGHLALAAELRSCAAEVRALRAHATGPHAESFQEEADTMAVRCRALESQLEAAEAVLGSSD